MEKLNQGRPDVPLSDKKNLRYPCLKCGMGPSWEIIKTIDSNERERFPYRCTICGKRTHCLAKKKDVPLRILTGPPSKTYKPKIGKCERCGAETHLEEHHWAPKKFFRDAHDWPTSYLCRACHEEWHQIMTGDLIKKHK